MATKPSLPKWVSDDDSSKITDPGATKKLAGWLYKERPAHQFSNWLLNVISKWLLGLQGGYFDIVVGSSTQVTNNEATNVIGDLNDTLVVAGSKVLFLDGTHTLTANLSLSNHELLIEGETTNAIIDTAGFQFSLSGFRSLVTLRIVGAGAGDVQLSGPGSRFVGISMDEAWITVLDSLTVEITGNTSLIKMGNNSAFNSQLLIVPPITGGTGAAYTAVLGLNSYLTDRVYDVQIHTDNTGSATFNFDAKGAKAAKQLNGSDLLKGQLKIGMIAKLLYDGTNFVLLNPEPADVDGFVNGKIYIENDTGAGAATFSISGFIGAAWESIGPSGSGANNFWTAMNSIPTNAKFAELRIHNSCSDTSGAAFTQKVYGRKTGSSETIGAKTLISMVGIRATGSTATLDENMTTAKLPLDSNRRFDLYFEAGGTSRSVTTNLIGFGI